MPKPHEDGNRRERGIIGSVGDKKKKDEPLDAYRRLRKPVPRPGRVIPDRRRELREEQERREAEREREEREKKR